MKSATITLPQVEARRKRLLGGADAIALLAIAVCFVLLCWPAIFGGRFLISGDSLVYTYPLRKVAWEMVRGGQLPLWTPVIFSGYPMLSLAQLGLGYPLTWGYLFLPAHWAEQIYLLAPYLLAPICTYAYVRQIGRSAPAALLAGLSFALGGLVFSPIGLNGMLSNAVLWLPLLLLATERARTAGFVPCLLLAACAYALSVLTGIGQGFVYAGGVALLYALFVSVTWPVLPRPARWQARLRPFVVCAGGMALGAGVAGFQILETQQAARRSVRAALSFAQFSDGGFPFDVAWKSWLDPVHEAYLAGDVTCYVAPLASLLALLGALAWLGRERDSRALFWLVVAVVAALFILGARTPLYGWLYQVPVVNRFRVASRHAFEWTFAVSILAAYGWDCLARWLAPTARATAATAATAGARHAPHLLAALIATVAAGLIAARWWSLMRTVDPNPRMIFGELNAGYVYWKVGCTLAVALAAVLALRVRRGRMLLASAVIVIACLVEPALMLSRWALPVSAVADRFDQMAATTEWLRRQPPAEGRVYTPVNPFAESGVQRPRIDAPNFGALAGLHEVAGYEPLLLERYSRALNSNVWTEVNRTPSLAPDNTLLEAPSHVLDLLNTQYVVGYAGLGQSPGELEQKDGISFSASNLGKDVSAETPLHLNGAPHEADTLALVTTLGNTSDVEEDEAVAHITIRTADGRAIERLLRAGSDTAELAHDRPDVLAAVRHRRAPIYDQMAPTPTYRYLARVPLGERVRVTGVEIIKLARTAGLGLWKASLFDAQTGQATPLTTFDTTRWEMVYEQNGAVILRNRRALPRAWLVTEAVALDEQAIWRRIRGLGNETFDPRRTALIEIEPHKLPQLDGGRLAADSFARVVHHEPNRIVIETRADRPTMLIVSEMHYPGWRATVDGAKTPIHTTDFLLRGVALPAGTHRVEMRYTAQAARTGAILSGLSLMVLVGLAIWARRTAKIRPVRNRER